MNVRELIEGIAQVLGADVGDPEAIESLDSAEAVTPAAPAKTSSEPEPVQHPPQHFADGEPMVVYDPVRVAATEERRKAMLEGGQGHPKDYVHFF